LDQSGGIFGLGAGNRVETAARILAAAHRAGANVLVCGTEADRVGEGLKQVGLGRVVCIEPGAVPVFGEPGDVLVLASNLAEPTTLMTAASGARNAGLRRIGIMPDGSREYERLLEFTLRPGQMRDVSQTINRILRHEEAVFLALSDGEDPRQGSQWAVRALRSRGIKVVDVSLADVFGWGAIYTKLKRSAEVHGIELERCRVISDLPWVLDAATASGATPEPVTPESGAAEAVRRILLNYAANPEARDSDTPQFLDSKQTS
jgi:hypothetical protein